MRKGARHPLHMWNGSDWFDWSLDSSSALTLPCCVCLFGFEGRRSCGAGRRRGTAQVEPTAGQGVGVRSRCGAEGCCT